ncbi:MAG: permease [Pseudomonadota bacterium]
MNETVLNQVNWLGYLADRIKSVWTLIVIIPFLVWLMDTPRLPEILEIAVSALASTAVYIAFAVMMIAYLKASGAESVVARAFEGRETRMIFFAALLGGLAPFCSCEVIPFIAGLLAVGAPLSAIMAFWLSSPLIDPPTVLITAGALGWDFAIGKAAAAVAIGLIGGFATKVLVGQGAFNNPLRPQHSGGCSACGPSPFQGKPEWKFWSTPERMNTFGREFKNNALFLFKWLAFAYLLEALLITYVPAEMIAGAVGGDGFLPIVIGALVGAPAYINSYAAPALVAGLIEQGMSYGAAMAFMVAGAVSSIPAMAGVWSLVRVPVFVAYVSLGIVGAIISGVVFVSVVG